MRALCYIAFYTPNVYNLVYKEVADMDKTFLTEINIVDVRHLQNIRIPLSRTERKHLILTGKNGSGKTSVLKSLVMSLKVG